MLKKKEESRQCGHFIIRQYIPTCQRLRLFVLGLRKRELLTPILKARFPSGAFGCVNPERKHQDAKRSKYDGHNDMRFLRRALP